MGATTTGEAREPLFRVPWPVLAILVAILLPRAIQSLAGDPQWVYARFGLTPDDLLTGRWLGLVSSLFVHGGWMHVLLNALGLLAFGPPVARMFGVDVKGRIAFFAFYLVCGVTASFGFCLVRIGQPGVLIGASGAISGLMGAASRLLDPAVGRANPAGSADGEHGPWGRRQDARLAPFTSRTVLAMAGAWILINVLVSFAPNDLVGGLPVAWEAHLFGYAAGLFLVGPTAALLGRL